MKDIARRTLFVKEEGVSGLKYTNGGKQKIEWELMQPGTLGKFTTTNEVSVDLREIEDSLYSHHGESSDSYSLAQPRLNQTFYYTQTVCHQTT